MAPPPFARSGPPRYAFSLCGDRQNAIATRRPLTGGNGAADGSAAHAVPATTHVGGRPCPIASGFAAEDVQLSGYCTAHLAAPNAQRNSSSGFVAQDRASPSRLGAGVALAQVASLRRAAISPSPPGVGGHPDLPAGGQQELPTHGHFVTERAGGWQAWARCEAPIGILGTDSPADPRVLGEPSGTPTASAFATRAVDLGRVPLTWGADETAAGPLRRAGR